MEIKGLIAEIKERFPDKAIDISESLELLKETINDTMTSINNEVSDAYNPKEILIVLGITLN